MAPKDQRNPLSEILHESMDSAPHNNEEDLYEEGDRAVIQPEPVLGRRRRLEELDAP